MASFVVDAIKRGNTRIKILGVYKYDDFITIKVLRIIFLAFIISRGGKSGGVVAFARVNGHY